MAHTATHSVGYGPYQPHCKYSWSDCITIPGDSGASACALLGSSALSNYSPNYRNVVYEGRDGSHHTQIDPLGWRPPTPYWGYRFFQTHVTPYGSEEVATKRWTSGWCYRKWSKYTIYRCLTATLDLPAGYVDYRPYFADLQNEAITACLAEIGESTADFGVELIEARKTVSYVADKLQFLARNTSDILHRKVPRDFRNWKRKVRKFGKKDKISWAAKSFPERWMEYRYAFQPTVFGIMDALRAWEERSGKPLIVTARKRVESVISDDTSSIYGAPPGLYVFKGTTTTRTYHHAAVYVVMTMTANNYLLRSLNDVGLQNPGAVWWEIMPFSWMIDWVANIGDYLSAINTLLYWDVKGATATHIDTRRKEVSFAANPNGHSSGYYPCSVPVFTPARAGGTSFNRVVLDPYTVEQSLRVHLRADFLNLTRCLDSVSLLSNLLRGKSVKGLRL
jgi:hypothetical protein